MLLSMVRLLLLGLGSAGVVGGPYILYLAFNKPGIFPKPNTAKWQGAVSLVVGILLLVALFIWKQ